MFWKVKTIFSNEFMNYYKNENTMLNMTIGLWKVSNNSSLRKLCELPIINHIMNPKLVSLLYIYGNFLWFLVVCT